MKFSSERGPDPARAGVERRHPRFCRSKQQKREVTTLFFRRPQARSKRSWSITLVHAATKSFTNFSFASAEA